MTLNQEKPMNKIQLAHIRSLAGTLLECSQHLANLFSRRHPDLRQAEFMIEQAHAKIHTTLAKLEIDF